MTYPDAPIQAPRDQVHVVKLQARYRPRVTHEAPVHLAAPEIPQPHHTIRRAARQRRVKDLQRPHKVRLGVR